MVLFALGLLFFGFESVAVCIRFFRCINCLALPAWPRVSEGFNPCYGLPPLMGSKHVNYDWPGPFLASGGNSKAFERFVFRVLLPVRNLHKRAMSTHITWTASGCASGPCDWKTSCHLSELIRLEQPEEVLEVR